MPIEVSWMIGFTSLKVYNSILDITEKKTNSKLILVLLVEFSFGKLKDELQEILSVSDITPSHLQHEVIRQLVIQAYKKVGSEKPSTDGYIILLIAYTGSPSRF